MPDEPKEFGYREEMPWFGGCFHLWVNVSHVYPVLREGQFSGTRQCRLCGIEQRMYAKNLYGGWPSATKIKAIE